MPQNNPKMEAHTDKSCLHLVFREVVRVQSEVSVAIHVVDVSPHDLQGNVSCLVLGHHLSQLLNILIAPPALPLAALYLAVLVNQSLLIKLAKAVDGCT